MRHHIIFISTSLLVVFACARGTVNIEDDDAGVKPDTSVTPPKDTGTTPQDTGTQKDTGPTCVTAPPSNVCGVFPQCGCASKETCEVAQKAPYDGSSSCVTAGSKSIGDTCGATANQCGVGLTCMFGVCRPYCGVADDPCTDTGTHKCLQLTNGTAPIPNMLVCTTDCELTDPSACGGAPNGCIYRDVDTTDCYQVGSATTCSKTTSCAPGSVCYSTDGQVTFKCGLYCKVGVTVCGGAKTCIGFGTKMMVGSTEYGVCN